MGTSAIFENLLYHDEEPPPLMDWVCLRKTYKSDIEKENISDVVEVILKVMSMCGIPEEKRNPCKEILSYDLTRFTEIAHRVDRWPHKRIRKEDLMHKLGCRAHLSRYEAQVTYTIFKRIFYAYHRRPGGCSLHLMHPEVKISHTEECRWRHAAKRTAQIYGMFEGLLPSVQRRFEARLNCMYRRLFDRLKIRQNLLVWPDCTCRDCRHKESSSSSVYLSDLRSADYADIVGEEMPEHEVAEEAREEESENVEENSSRRNTSAIRLRKSYLEREYCQSCNCPELTCLCEFDDDAEWPPNQSHECGQGELRCLWVPALEKWFAEPEVHLPDEISICPPCSESSVVYEHECCYENERRKLEELSEEGIESYSDPWGPYCELTERAVRIDQVKRKDKYDGCRIVDCTGDQLSLISETGEEEAQTSKSLSESSSKTDRSAEKMETKPDVSKKEVTKEAIVKKPEKKDVEKTKEPTKKPIDKKPEKKEKQETKVEREEPPKDEKKEIKLPEIPENDAKPEKKETKTKPKPESPAKPAKKPAKDAKKVVKPSGPSKTKETKPEDEAKLEELEVESKEPSVKEEPIIVVEKPPEPKLKQDAVNLLCPDVKKKPVFKVKKRKPKPCPKAVCKKRRQLAQGATPTDPCDDPWGFGRPHMLF